MTASEMKTITRDVAGTRLTATAAAELQPMIDGLLGEFERLRADWFDGYELWLGWGPLYLSERDGGFVVTSPDYARNPRTDRSDVITAAIALTVGQSSIITAAEVQPEDVGFDDAVICVREWEAESMLSMSRISSTTPGDSGWFIEPFPPADRAKSWQPDELVRLPAWRVLQLRAAVARALPLPVGVSAIIDGDRVRVVIRDSEILANGPL
ncbi:hypothetical protein SAMN04489740_4280 [Arthrobacter alpinus]|uniref:Imm33-like domain-containing protein n=1 Tax=Arthrobacter alpinus TaxID=656366 RepID=A0A1H5PG53_9MICC|nr:hypothetical protein [Arthrobacter alpinus]SEF12730.1 hypothetical protein SAMN04489740_4280 [Arthrobacter alpinus]